MNEKAYPEKIKAAFPYLDKIQSLELQEAIIACWVRVWEESNWDDLRGCPFNPAFPDVPLVDHINCVAELLMTSAEVMERHNEGLVLDRDYLLTGAFLHDLSKMVEIEPGPNGPGFSALNANMPHATYGAIVAMAQGLDVRVANIILAHTRLTGALPNSPEAVLLHYLDYGLADVLRARQGLKLIMDGGPTYGK